VQGAEDLGEALQTAVERRGDAFGARRRAGGASVSAARMGSAINTRRTMSFRDNMNSGGA